MVSQVLRFAVLELTRDETHVAIAQLQKMQRLVPFVPEYGLSRVAVLLLRLLLERKGTLGTTGCGPMDLDKQILFDRRQR